MKNSAWSLVALIVLLMGPAYGVIDPDPDQIGIYFDPEATSNSIQIGPNQPFNTFIVLTRASRPDCEGFVASYRLEVDEGYEPALFRLSVLPPDDRCMLGCDDEGGDLLGDTYLFQFSAPYPTGDAFVLKAWTFMLLADFSVRFYLGEPDPAVYVGDSPSYFSGGEAVALGVSSGSFDEPVAVVNGPAPVGTRSASFGAVKSLYR